MEQKSKNGSTNKNGTNSIIQQILLIQGKIQNGNISKSKSEKWSNISYANRGQKPD